MKNITFFLMIANIPAIARDVSYVNDPFGYQVSQNCQFEYLNIDAQANELVLQASGSDPAQDEGAAVINLPVPYTYYNESYSGLVVSSNGYLSFADSLTQENGADFSNDCMFPSIPDNQPTALARIMPFHDDLSSGPGGKIQWAHFASCPLSAHNNPCTVIEWQNWQDSTETFSFQVILIHHASAIVMQFNDQTPAPVSASIGFQHAELFSGQVLSCNQPKTDLTSQSYCYQNPYIFQNGFELVP